MNSEILQEADFVKITQNQLKISEELDRTNQILLNANDLSNRFVGEAIHNFKKGTETISRIRNNLDQIHKALLAISKLRTQS